MTLREAAEQMYDAVIWMSGASDFAPEGKASEGWAKVRAKLDEWSAALSASPRPPDTEEARPLPRFAHGDIPRRNCPSLFAPMERAVRAAFDVVESGPADVRLTRAGNALQDALAWLADYYEDVPEAEHYPRAAPSGEPAPDTATDLDLAPVAVEAMMQQAARLGWDAIHRLLHALNPERPRPLDDEAKALTSRALRELRVFAPFGSPLAAPSPVESGDGDDPSADGDEEDGEEECQCPEGFHVGAEPPPEGCGVESCEPPVESAPCTGCGLRPEDEDGLCDECRAPVESGESGCSFLDPYGNPCERPEGHEGGIHSGTSADGKHRWWWTPAGTTASGLCPKCGEDIGGDLAIAYDAGRESAVESGETCGARRASPDAGTAPTGAAETRECQACQRGDPCPENDRIRASPEVNAVRAAATALRDRMRAIGDDDLPLDVLDALDALDAALNDPEGR